MGHDPALDGHRGDGGGRDVGCGVGTWLATALELGIERVKGFEGNWVDKSALVVDAEGRTLMPGFIDGHGHLGLENDQTQASADLSLADTVGVASHEFLRVARGQRDRIFSHRYALLVAHARGAMPAGSAPADRQ